MDISTWPLLKCQLIIRQRYASPVCHTKSCLFGNLRSQCLDGYFSKHADCSWPYILVSVWLVATYCLSNSVFCCGTFYIKSCYLWLCKQVVHEKAWWKGLFGYQQFFLRFLKFWQSNRATSNLINKWFALDSQVRPASRRFIIAAITELKHFTTHGPVVVGSGRSMDDERHPQSLYRSRIHPWRWYKGILVNCTSH